MRTLEEKFNLVAWASRMDWTQAVCAAMLGMSKSAYCSSEYRQKTRTGYPARSQMVILAKVYEHLKEKDPALLQAIAAERGVEVRGSRFVIPARPALPETPAEHPALDVAPVPTVPPPAPAKPPKPESRPRKERPVKRRKAKKESVNPRRPEF